LKGSITLDPLTIDPIYSSSTKNIEISILRLDKLHPIVSGNKWFKLRYYVEDAIHKSYSTLASFGGPYSNHLVALAFVAKENNLKSIGYVRSSKEDIITPSLKEAISYGMQLEFIGRTHFQEIKNNLLKTNQHKRIDESSAYFIDEGGYGLMGAKGAASILNAHNKDYTTKNYSTIIAAVGTGTMLAGLINAAEAHQQVIGVPVLKNENTIEDEIKSLLINKEAPFTLLHSYHQGGYAKTNSALFAFMNQFWTLEKIPTDIVYTGKLLYAVDSLLKKNYFKKGSKILVIHSGGLQGNRSLPFGTLLY
jgi:1-aminocyclopropane-1-carboxylate deaminase